MTTLFLISIIVIILIVGLLANREITRDKERQEVRRREIARWSVFKGDLEKMIDEKQGEKKGD